MMRSRKRETVFMGLGVLAGLALSGSTVQAADYLTARSSSQTFFIDGQQTALTAYSIGGNNYVRLRDIGQAVDFGVTYDAATNSVHIDSPQHYSEESPVVPSGPTEESVQAVLAQLKQTYSTGTVYPTPYRSTNGGPLPPWHPLLRLGYAVFGRSFWEPTLAEDQLPKLGAAQTRRPGGISKF